MGKNQRAGASWEQTVVDYLVANGFPFAERRVMGGTNDRGDIAGIPGVMLECKNEKRMDLAGYMGEVKTQTENAGAEIGVAVVKRRNHQAKDAYVVMTLEQFADMIR